MIDGDIHLAAGATLRSLPRLLTQLGIPGLSLEGLKALCEALCVPCVRIHDTWFVNIFTLQIAMCSATQIGNDDFVFPESDMAPTYMVPEKVFKTLPLVITQLVESRRSTFKDAHDKLIDAGRELSERLASAGVSMMLEKYREEPYAERSKRLDAQYRETLTKVEKALVNPKT